MTKLSIKWKVTFIAGCCLLVSAVGLLSISGYFNGKSQQTVSQLSLKSLKQSSEHQVMSDALIQAAAAKAFIDEASYRAQMLAQSVLFLKHNAEENYTNSSELRNSVGELLRRSVENFPKITGAFAVFEPDQLDGEDSNYHGADYAGANELGRFASYWSGDVTEQSQAVLSEEVIAGREALFGEQRFDWYSCAKSAQSLCVITPYADGGSALTTTIIVPLKVEDEVVGVMGVNVSLDRLINIISQADQAMFNGVGNLYLISSDGKLITGDAIGAEVGDDLIAQRVLPKDVKTWLEQGDPQTSWTRDGSKLRVFTPLTTGAQPWGVYVELPADSVLDGAYKLASTISEQHLEARNIQWLVSALVIGFGLVIVYFAAGQIVKPLQFVVAKLKDIASGEGDLTQRIPVTREDEIGELSIWFNRFLDKLQRAIKDVVESVEEIDNTAHGAASVAGNTRDGSQHQFREVDMVATAAEQMSHTASEVANHTESALSATQFATSAASEGRGEIDASSLSMQELASRLSDAIPIVENLEKSNTDINQILSVIEGVSDQTNLLALNAAIEAARAGDQGKGFAVVAEEVRQLALRTSDSVGQIRTVIEQVGKGTESVVNAINEGNKLAVDTTQKFEKAADSLSTIADAVVAIENMNEQIARAAEEQRTVATEVNRNVSNIREQSEAILSHAEQSADIGQRLASLSEQQRQVVQQFVV
ncbi:methyl-accepting chemotaxis protein [Grimontia kaedaensis]|uniref:Methyl-accepting chemotaxis protein n=1 Tax=Grimontia kaedaensis TaxID=2872157 RepID=A0ABY4WPQ9_9GAMM|nr:methyl-accepting chemotaxis protein [Grimontia kaedaensis]USH01577.1 methyl-accepting chemotaxis protein [Grimontia kaedaensis]